jgi:hypothetical protein
VRLARWFVASRRLDHSSLRRLADVSLHVSLFRLIHGIPQSQGTTGQDFDRSAELESNPEVKMAMAWFRKALEQGDGGTQ